MGNASFNKSILMIATGSLLLSLFFIDRHSLLLLWFLCIGGALVLSNRLSFPKITAVCILGILVGVLYSIWLLIEGHPVSMRRLARIEHGAHNVDVARTLGKPSIVLENAETTTWRYTGATWCIVEVHFDSHGKVTNVSHDH